MKKILSIDGGGCRGLIPITLLKYMENNLLKKSVVDTFDFFAGTSTGGIISLLLANGMSMNDIYNFYTKEPIHKIFKGKMRLNPLDAVKYPSKDIEGVLNDIFKDIKLKDVRPDKGLLITTYDILSKQAVFFTREDKRYSEIALAQIARATSAAPTFFESYVLNEMLCVDGGVFANNPALCAYVGAQKMYPNEEVVLVSLGTGSLYEYVDPNKIKKYNMLDWATNLFDLVSDGQSDTTEYVLRKTLPIKDYWRFQVRLSKNNSGMDNVSDLNLRDLENLARNYINNEWYDELDDLVKILNS